MESNKLIAEFMGGKWEWVNKPSFIWEKHYPKMTRVEECELPFNTLPKGYQSNRFEPKRLFYHEDWNWLMPVVEKCLEKHNYLIHGRDIIDTSYSTISEGLNVVSIKETYKAIVEFIKQTKN